MIRIDSSRGQGPAVPAEGRAEPRPSWPTKRGIPGAAAASLALLLGLAAAAPARAAGKMAGVLTKIEGEVKIRPAGKRSYERVSRNKFVYEGDVILTGNGAGCALVFQEGVEVRINERSRFEVTAKPPDAEAREREVGLQFGQVWSRMVSGKGKFKIRTPRAVAAVRGTEADVEMRRNLTVLVYEGIVDVENPLGKQTLTEGKMTRVGEGRAPEPPRDIPKGAAPSWHEELESGDSEDALEELRESSREEAAEEKTLEIEVKDGDKTRRLRLKFKKGD